MDYSSFIGSQLFSVKGRTCIVTGGGTGIGKGMAAAHTLNGAKVFIIGRRFNVVQETANELTDAAASAQSGGQCIPIEGDVATKKGVSDVYKKIVNLTDRPDYLVNNAVFSANWRKQCPYLNDPVGLEEQLWSIEDSDFANMTAIHCAGPYFLGVKSLSANTHMANPKAAEVHLTRLMAAGLLPYKFRCNSVCPGLFRSQLTTGTADPDAPLWPSMQRATEEAIPARRAGKWEEIAGAVLMLASTAGAYFNEAELVIDSGWRLCASAKDVK
ncbi:hypothetical protein I312_105007 [Cryptococcus bacillisporus CA1280]|uniref:uncharacterized protein n=1 Tax=Cryptococcus bacillisporus CA1280 TaxID=1296109 RepID=UPI003369B428